MRKARFVPAKKSERDRAIDAAISAASAQAGSQPAGPILVRRDSTSQPPANGQNKASPKRDVKQATATPTAIAIALAKVGLATEAKPPPPQQKAAAPSKPDPKAPAQPVIPPASAPPKAKPTKKTKKTKPVAKAKPKIKRWVTRSKPMFPDACKPVSEEDARTMRMDERRKEAARAIARISLMSPDELLSLWARHIQSAQDKKSKFQDLARDYITAIEGEWQRRTILARLDPEHFVWPTTQASPGSGAYGVIEHAEGILAYVGYHVGKTGEQSSSRREAILSRVFEGPLPPINGPDYMKEWSEPQTPARLRKMAESIASAVKAAKRRNHADYSVAIEHWEADLGYLYRNYYVGKFGFDWPVRAEG